MAIIGLGVMGQQVAWAAARAGHTVRAFDASSEQLQRAMFIIEGWFQEDRDPPAGDIKACNSLEEALDGATLAFENVPELLDLKRAVHAEIDRLGHARLLQGSNASAITCSAIASATRRPENFFNMNFCHPRHGEKLVEVMGNPATSESTLGFARQWARSMGLVPIVLRREIMGYVQNRIWRAIKKEALFLADHGYLDPADIDRGFILAMGTRLGPFARMDNVGLHSVLRVEEQYYAASRDVSDRPPRVLTDLVEKGRLGAHAGGGFYSYPHPLYEQTDWLSGADDP